MQDILELTLVRRMPKQASLLLLPIRLHTFSRTHFIVNQQRAPSSFNLQPSQIVLAEDQAVRDEIAKHAMIGPGNQYRVRDCAALAVFLADLEPGKRIDRIQELERDWGGRHPSYTGIFPLASSFLLGEGHAATFVKQVSTSLLSSVKAMPEIEPVQAWSYKNTGLLAQQYVLACASHDLATSMMEGMDARRLREVLRVPDRYAIPMVIATGYEYEAAEERTPRLAIEELVFRNEFGTPWTAPDGEEEDESSASA